MKTKKEILKMSKQELIDYKWKLKLKENSDCSYCFNCSDCVDCSDCFYCVDCAYCRNIEKPSRYMICNVQFTKKEYKKKMGGLI